MVCGLTAAELRAQLEVLFPGNGEAIAADLRAGLADEVRHFDALGREVRGDGSLVEDGECDREHW